jgi:ankyrin repeat protein
MIQLTQPREMKTTTYLYGVEMLDGNDAWALFEASAMGDVSKVKSLLAKDRRLANAQHWYQFPIHFAVFGGHSDVVRLLLDHGADPGQSLYTYYSWDKLLHAARLREHRQIESLLQKAMRKRFRYAPEFDELKDGIIARDSKKVNTVLRRQPALVSAADALGNNALHWAVITRQLEMIRRFVEIGTPIDARRADGATPVLLAASGATDYWFRATRGRSHPSLRNSAVLVGALIALGAEYTISVAAAMGDLERIEQIVKNDPKAAVELDSARISPLSYAADQGHLHIVRRLLELGAKPNQPEDAAPQGRALFEACRGNHLQIAELLLEHGADPNAGVDSCGCCLTICEVYNGDRARPLQELLRQRGALTPPYAMDAREMRQAIRDGLPSVRDSVFAEHVVRTRDAKLLDFYLDSDPEAVRHLDLRGIAELPNAAALVRKLLARGLDANQTDWCGKSLLHVAAETGHQGIAEVLLRAGADLTAREIEFQGTPLASAVRASSDAKESSDAERGREMTKFLLKHGAKPELPDDAPWSTPLAWARRRHRDDLVSLLSADE